MAEVRVFSSDPGIAELLAAGSVFNVILQAQRAQRPVATGAGSLVLVGAVTCDRGRPNVCVDLPGRLDDLRTRYGGFNPYVGDGVASGYNGNLYARAKGLDAPRVRLLPVDLALKDKSVADPTAVDLLVKLARGSLSFSVEESDDVFTCSGHGLEVGDTFQIVSLTGGTGATVATTYHVIDVVDANSFKASATSGGASLAITLDGTGRLRPISVAAGIDLATRTIPAGTRIRTANSGFVVRTLEDVTWTRGDFAEKTVRVAKVSGTEAALNTVSTIVLSSTRDAYADGTYADSTLVVTTTATTVADAVDAAELVLRYGRAFDAILDTVEGQDVNAVVVCDRSEAAIGDLLASHCVTASSRGYWRIGVVDAPVGTSAATAEGSSGVGVGRSTLTQSAVAYVHQGVRRPFYEDADNLSAADSYLATVPGAMAFAGRVANTPPWENPARPHPVLKSYGMAGLEALSPPVVPQDHQAVGIVVPEFVRQGTAMVASFRDGIMADRSKVADVRLRHYLADGLLGVLAGSHKEPATQANLESAEVGCRGLLEVLAAEGKIARYAMSLESDSANDHLRARVAVDKTGNWDVITLDLLVGGSAVAQSGIEQAA